MSSVNSDKQFLGTGWSFPPRFNKGNNGVAVSMVSDDDDIRESLRILLGTSPGERVMYPEYGCGLKKMVFEKVDESSVTALRDTISRAILFFEPRITLEGIDVDTSQLFDGYLLLTLDYIIRTTNSRSNIVYPFYLNEGSNVRL